MGELRHSLQEGEREGSQGDYDGEMGREVGVAFSEDGRSGRVLRFWI